MDATTEHLRPWRATDLEALYDICLRTGASGQDASDLVEDPRLFGELFAAPYATLEPEHAFVLDDGTGQASGYVLGALDAVAFEARCEAAWWPPLRERHPIVAGGTRLDDLLIALLHHRPSADPDLARTYPSELHVDLLPEAQGRGWGARMVRHLLDALREDGSPGVHLGVAVDNTRAIGFYRHLGFHEVGDNGSTLTFGLRLP